VGGDRGGVAVLDMADQGLRVPAPYRVIRFDDIDSTNTEALRLADSGVREDTWIVAARQTAGRGRRGRLWVSERGNLYSTLLLFPRCDLGTAAGLTFVAGLAILRAVAEMVPDLADKLRLKWPNDLLLNGNKIGGILLESAGRRESGRYALVIGCGVNCAHHPDDAAYPVTDLGAEGYNFSLDALFEAYAHHFDDARRIWQDGAGFASIRDAWLRHCAGLGREITVKLQNQAFTGIFRGLDSSGQLILGAPAGDDRVIAAGDVFFKTR